MSLANSISTRDASVVVLLVSVIVDFDAIFIVGLVVVLVNGLVVALFVVGVVGAVVRVRGSIEQSDIVRLSNASFEPPFV